MERGVCRKFIVLDISIEEQATNSGLCRMAVQDILPPASVFKRRQSLQDFRGHRPIDDWIVFADFSIAKDEHTLCELRNIMFVRHYNYGQALVVQRLEYLHDFDRGAAVEIAGRLVGEQDRWMVHQGTGNRNSLLLSARHLRREVLCAVGEPYHGKRI